MQIKFPTNSDFLIKDLNDQPYSLLNNLELSKNSEKYIKTLNKTKIYLLITCKNEKINEKNLLLITPLDKIKNDLAHKLYRFREVLFSYYEDKDIDEMNRISKKNLDDNLKALDNAIKNRNQQEIEELGDEILNEYGFFDGYQSKLTRHISLKDPALKQLIYLAPELCDLEVNKLFPQLSVNPYHYFSKNLGGYKTICPVFFDKEEARRLLMIAAEEFLDNYLKIYLNGKYKVYVDYYKKNDSFLVIKNRKKLEKREKLEKEHIVKKLIRKNIRRIDTALINRLKTKKDQNAKSYLTKKKQNKQSLASIDQPKEDEIEIQNILNTKILTIGLGDFMKFYLKEENNTLKKTEFLFIPNSKQFKTNKKNLKQFIQKSPVDMENFNDYQRKFYKNNYNSNSKNNFTITPNFKNKA